MTTDVPTEHRHRRWKITLPSKPMGETQLIKPQQKEGRNLSPPAGAAE
jgi:hypothetical protein